MQIPINVANLNLKKLLVLCGIYIDLLNKRKLYMYNTAYQKETFFDECFKFFTQHVWVGVFFLDFCVP